MQVIEGYADQSAYEAHLATSPLPQMQDANGGHGDIAWLIGTDPITLKVKDQISS